MFKETIDKWNTSLKEKEDRLHLARNVHNGLMDVKNIQFLLEKSVIDHMEIGRNGILAVLDDEHGNFKMYINEMDCEEAPMTLLCSGNYEAEETDMVYKLLQYYKEDEEFVMFDVGANVGWYSLNGLHSCPKMKLYAFEPSPITYERLVNNLEVNGFCSRIAYNIGFYRESGKLDFYYDSKRAGASSLVNIQEKECIDKISVNMLKMDEWAEENKIEKVDFIKCDVEGSELFVYEGGINLIAKNHPIIFSEMLRKWSAKFGYHPNDIIDLLSSVGYECFTIQEKGKLKRFGRVDEDTMETNYFFLHPEKHARMIADLSI